MIYIHVCSEQEKLKSQLIEEDSDEVKSWHTGGELFGNLKYIAGVDISFEKENPNHACAMLTILSFPELTVSNFNGCNKSVVCR